MRHLCLFSLLPIMFCTCTRKTVSPDNVITPAAGDISLQLAISPSVGGVSIPASFTGLSYETSSLTKAGYFSTASSIFINLVKNLGNGILRVGGNSSDKTFWANTTRSGSTATDTLFTDDVDSYFQFANATGWKTLFGINVGSGTTQQAALEAPYAVQSAKGNLLYFELGNEPDLYHSNGLRTTAYSVTDYETDFTRFNQSILAAAATAQFSGPTSAYNTKGFTIPFANSLHAKISLLTQHYYALGPAGDPSVTVSALLKTDTSLASNTSLLISTAQSYQLAYRLSECNSVYNGGQAGVSNAFASALWGADYMFTLAQLGCNGVNFHGGGSGAYTPIAYASGVFTPRPLYYGMLVFKLSSQGSFIQNSLTAGAAINCRAYTVSGNDGKYYITLINKDLTGQAYVTITGLPAYHTTQVIRLNAPSATATTNILLGNAAIDANGNWANTSTEIAGINSTGYQLEIPPASIAVLIINK